jgi:hypothetical protein
MIRRARFFRVESMLVMRALLLVLALPVVAASAQQRRALLVGIDGYDLWRAPVVATAPVAASTPVARAKAPALAGPVNDVRALRTALVSQQGFSEADVRLLTDRAATREGILQAIDSLVSVARAGDVVLFYFAGHGSRRLNSRARTLSRLEPTIVPVDVNGGGFDIRTRELKARFAPLLDRRVELILIFDSCHSGGLTRTLDEVTTRFTGVDLRDAADIDSTPSLESRGALVLSAAQDYQVAIERRDTDGVAHGVFTSALLAAWQSGSPNEAIGQSFRRVRAIVQSDGLAQEPVLAATSARAARTLFGGLADASAQRPLVAVLSARDDGVLDVQGGTAIGLSVGSVLQLRRDSSVRAEVRQVDGLNRATAMLRDTPAAAVRSGDLFTVVTRPVAIASALRVHLPDPLPNQRLDLALDELRGIAAPWRVGDLRRDTLIDSLIVARPRARGWTLRAGRDSVLVDGALTTDLLDRTARAHRWPVGVVLPWLPPTATNAQALTDRLAGLPIARTPSRDAHYLLVHDTLGASWVRTAPDGSPSALPLRTDRVAATAVDTLARLASRLSRLHGWLTLRSPDEAGGFPYQLALRRVDGGTDLATTDTLRDDDAVTLLLRRTTIGGLESIRRRRVYVMVIDSDGCGTVVFPQDADVGNTIPASDSVSAWPDSIVLPRSPVRIGPPFGRDHWILLTSEDAVPLDALAVDGVRTRELATSPLGELLANTGIATRAAPRVIPGQWSIEHRDQLTRARGSSPAVPPAACR